MVLERHRTDDSRSLIILFVKVRGKIMNARNSLLVRPWTRWQDWCNVVLGIILFISPWYSATWSHGTSSWDAWILGVAVAIVALWSLAMPRPLIPEGVNIVLGICVLISPWVLGFVPLGIEAWSAWIIGVLVVLFDVWALSEMRNLNMRVSA